MNVTRLLPRLLTALVMMLSASVLSFQVPPTQPAQPPNILIIFSDDHALQAISAYGSPYIQTPNIDRIAREGAIFNNMFCTNSICAPSRATLLTGKYSHINGHRDNKAQFDAGQDMFPKHLQTAGYQTGWIGKWHLQATPQYFDYWTVLPGQGAYYSPDFIQMDGQTVRQEGYATNLITDKALQWLDRQRDKAKPFCLVVGQKAPHRTWFPDTTDLHAFDGIKFPLPKTFDDNYEGRLAAQKQKMQITKDLRMAYDLKYEADQEPALKRLNPAQLKVWKAYYDVINADFKKQNPTGKALDAWKFQRYMNDYLGCVVSLDRNIGRILDYLDKNGLTENTIVVYASDQGFYLGEHGWFDKRFMYEPSFHMPLVMRYPKLIKPKTVVNGMVANIDFAPTFLQLAGVSAPKEMQGKSFLPMFNSKAKDSREGIYYHYYEYPDEHAVMPHFGIRTKRYKLIRFYGDGDFWELYDLQKDPNELKNLYESPNHQVVAKKMKQDLLKLIREYQDTEAEQLLAKEGGHP